MNNTRGLILSPTQHSLKAILSKGFDPSLIKETFDHPARVYESRSHEGQFRVTGNGLCLVGKPEGSRFILITVYEDNVLTPPRGDQLDTPEGRRYSKRYGKGLGRG